MLNPTFVKAWNATPLYRRLALAARQKEFAHEELSKTIAIIGLLAARSPAQSRLEISEQLRAEAEDLAMTRHLH